MLTNENEACILWLYPKENGGGSMALNLEKLKEIRIASGLTQDEMAKRMGWKTRTPYAKRENGFVDTGADELQKMAEILGYSKNQLGIFFTYNVLEKERKEEK